MPLGVSSPWTLTIDGDDKPCGKIHRVSNNYKATCMKHKAPGENCVCYISCPPGMDRDLQVFEDLMTWLLSMHCVFALDIV